MISQEKEILEQLTSLDYVKKGLEFLEDDQDNSIEEQIDLVVIEAPTGHEENRAKEMCKKFEELGLSDIHTDAIGNAIGVMKGTQEGLTLLVEAHMDTVFPLGTVTQRPEIDENGIIHCPGIGDNTRGLAVILAVIRAMRASKITPKATIIFAGTAREEGTGSLGGMKHLLQDHPEIDACISVDGGGFTNITFNATGIKTLRYTFHGLSGHSMGHFGVIAQCAHALGRAIATISDIEVPEEPRSCFAVTSVKGGTLEGLHAIPEEVSFIINYRSNTSEVLKQIEDQVEDAVSKACLKENQRWGKEGEITYSSEILCEAPAGTQEADTPLVRAFAEVVRFMKEEPEYTKGGCTNANVPVGKGIPAVCMGGGIKMDMNVHSLKELFPVKDAYKCPQAAYLLILLAAGTQDTKTIF